MPQLFLENLAWSEHPKTLPAPLCSNKTSSFIFSNPCKGLQACEIVPYLEVLIYGINIYIYIGMRVCTLYVPLQTSPYPFYMNKARLQFLRLRISCTVLHWSLASPIIGTTINQWSLMDPTITSLIYTNDTQDTHVLYGTSTVWCNLLSHDNLIQYVYVYVYVYSLWCAQFIIGPQTKLEHPWHPPTSSLHVHYRYRYRYHFHFHDHVNHHYHCHPHIWDIS